MLKYRITLKADYALASLDVHLGGESRSNEVPACPGTRDQSGHSSAQYKESTQPVLLLPGPPHNCGRPTGILPQPK